MKRLDGNKSCINGCLEGRRISLQFYLFICCLKEMQVQRRYGKLIYIYVFLLGRIILAFNQWRS